MHKRRDRCRCAQKKPMHARCMGLLTQEEGLSCWRVFGGCRWLCLRFGCWRCLGFFLLGCGRGWWAWSLGANLRFAGPQELEKRSPAGIAQTPFVAFDDARVAARPIFEPRPDFLE